MLKWSETGHSLSSGAQRQARPKDAAEARAAYMQALPPIAWSLRMARKIIVRPTASPASSVLALAVGAAALGALAIGALAIGRLAVGRLEIKKARFGTLEVDELTVHRLHVLERHEGDS